MLDGHFLVDAHLHPARLPTVKPAWRQWARDFGDAAALDRIYDAAGTPDPARFDTYLAGEGVDVALLLTEYSPKVTGIQPAEDVLPLVAHCGTSSFPGSVNSFADPVAVEDVLHDFRDLDIVLAHGGREAPDPGRDQHGQPRPTR